MLTKNRIGLFTLLLATGFISVGEASAGRDAGVPAAGPKQAACTFIGCPDEVPHHCASTSISVGIPGVGEVSVDVTCHQPRFPTPE